MVAPDIVAVRAAMLEASIHRFGETNKLVR